jgi:hypothetical protein
MGLTTWTKLTPSLLSSLFTPLLSRTTVRVAQDPPLANFLFLYGILEFLGGFNSPRTGVSDSPTFFLLRVFSPLLDLFTPWIDSKSLWCIVSIHVLEQPPTISLSLLG